MNTITPLSKSTYLFFCFTLILFSLSIYQCSSTKSSSPKKPKRTEKVILGEKIFQRNCTSCHSKGMKKPLTAPALGGVEDRWKKEDLYAWIRNSQAFLKTGDPYANELYLKYNKSVMTAFPDLKDKEIEAILAYIDYQFRQ